MTNNLSGVMYIAGHKQPATTARYMRPQKHAAEEVLAAAALAREKRPSKRPGTSAAPARPKATPPRRVQPQAPSLPPAPAAPAQPLTPVPPPPTREPATSTEPRSHWRGRGSRVAPPAALRIRQQIAGIVPLDRDDPAIAAHESDTRRVSLATGPGPAHP